MGPLQERTIVSRNMGRVEFRENRNLRDNILDVVFGIFDINDFDRDWFTIPVIDTSVYSSRQHWPQYMGRSDRAFGQDIPFVNSPKASTTWTAKV